MRGLIATLNKQRAQFLPVAAPIVYLKRDGFAGVELGEISAARASAAATGSCLRDVEQGYARLIGA